MLVQIQFKNCNIWASAGNLFILVPTLLPYVLIFVRFTISHLQWSSIWKTDITRTVYWVVWRGWALGWWEWKIIELLLWYRKIHIHHLPLPTRLLNAVFHNNSIVIWGNLYFIVEPAVSSSDIGLWDYGGEKHFGHIIITYQDFNVILFDIISLNFGYILWPFDWDGDDNGHSRLG